MEPAGREEVWLLGESRLLLLPPARRRPPSHPPANQPLSHAPLFPPFSISRLLSLPLPPSCLDSFASVFILGLTRPPFPAILPLSILVPALSPATSILFGFSFLIRGFSSQYLKHNHAPVFKC